MRSSQPAVEAVESHSAAEERFNRHRRTIGLFLGPALFAATLAWPIPSLTPEAHRLSAVMVLVITLWVTEALPIPITALLGSLIREVLKTAPISRNSL